MTQPLNAHHHHQAQLANAWWHARLGPSPLEATAPNDHTIAAVCHVQAQAHVRVDGVLSPMMRAHLAARAWQAPIDNRLVVDGQALAPPANVQTVSCAQREGFDLTDAQDAWRPRARPHRDGVELIVLHWDECPDTLSCFHTLLQRRLSAHLLIDDQGVVWQTLDLVRACGFHARTHNERSVGIEIQNGVSPCRPGAQPTRPTVCEPQAHTGRQWHITAFTPAQHTTLRHLVPWLCDTLGVPQVLPHTDGTICQGMCAPDFQGVVGHYHLQQDKCDPGMSLWPHLRLALKT